MADHLHYQIEGEDVILDVEATVPPPLFGSLTGHRWLDKYQSLPLSKKDRQRLRNTALDGVLTLARTFLAGALVSLIAHGEAGLVAAALLSEDVRRNAYKERHVQDREREDLEAAVQDLTHMVLLAPMGFPAKAYLPVWRELLPEAAAVAVPPAVQVFVVVPALDAAQDHVRAFQQTLLGFEMFAAKFPGPAYRTWPTGLVLEDLRRTRMLEITAGMTSSEKMQSAERPRLVVECFAGKAPFTAAVARLGFTVKAFEKYPFGRSGDALPEGDLGSAYNQTQICDDIRQGRAFHVHLAPDCGTFGPLSNLNGSTRTAEQPQGDGTLESERLGNKTMAIALWIIFLCLIYGVSFGYEHPRRSKSFKLCFFLWLLSLVGIIFVYEYDGCAWGHRPSDYHPSHGDVRTQKASIPW